MRTFPIYCGHERAGVGCTQLAVATVEAQGRSATACTQHLASTEKWASDCGRNTVLTRPVKQADDAVSGDGQGALFELGGLV